MAKYHVTLQQSSSTSTITTSSSRKEGGDGANGDKQQQVPIKMACTSLATGTLRPLLAKAENDNDYDDNNDCCNDDDDKMTAAIHAEEEAENDKKKNSIVHRRYYCYDRIHVIILVHGWLGCPQDLGYLHHAMENQASKLVKQQQQQQQEEREEGEEGIPKEKEEKEPFYVYTCTSNNGNTNDGIVAGSDRIAKEIQDYLYSLQNQYRGSNVQEITLSIVGYSLGGLYSRYALPKIIPPPSPVVAAQQQEELFLPKIIPKVFCTVATPHLGTKGHTWMRIPKFIEKTIITSQLSPISQTGRDLFHHSRHIRDTIFNKYWFEPLLQFEKRIAYANTYSMDFMVPTSTAAFVIETSESEHYFVSTSQQPTRSFSSSSSSSSSSSFFTTSSTTTTRRRSLQQQQQQSCSSSSTDFYHREVQEDKEDGRKEETNNNNNNNNPFVALVVETPKRHELLFTEEQNSIEAHNDDDQNNNNNGSSDNNNDDPLLDAIMAKRLDAMGWTKVFVDFSNTHDPSTTITTTGSTATTTTTANTLKTTTSARASSFSSSSSLAKGGGSSSSTTSSGSDYYSNSSNNNMYTSSALHSEFNRSKKKNLFLPVGHDLVVVNSKNVFSSYASRRGRPLVDQLARDLIQDIVTI